MKKVLSVLAALAVIGGSASCFGAAAINLSNYDGNNLNGAPIYYLTSGAVATGAGFWAEVYIGGQPVQTTFTGNASVFAIDQGYFDGGTGTTTAVADDATTTVTLHVWKGDGTSGAWANAKEGDTLSWDQKLGHTNPLPNLPTSATFTMGTAASMTIVPVAVPEPTTLALGLIGAAGLLFFRRK